MTAVRPVPPLASLWLRLGVRLALGLVGTLLVVTTMFLLGRQSLLWSVVLVLVGFVFRAALAAFLVRPGRHNGQSLSKQLTGMRVVDEQGLPISYGKAFAREAAWPLLIGVLSFVLVGVLLALADGIAAIADDQRRRLIDRILGTRVVVADPVPSWIPEDAGPPQVAWWPGAAGAQAPAMAFSAPAPQGWPDGWYRDPSNPAVLRYWAGGTWTEHTHLG
ncbi:MAG: RDD family protein [Solirubrobacteraceae bacterium]|nr:RDD family protein [Solirubrobacteraceae bacterium]